MKVVIQRVDSSSVTVNMDEISSIDNGLLILWGVEVGDSIEDVNILTEKILNLRKGLKGPLMSSMRKCSGSSG